MSMREILYRHIITAEQINLVHLEAELLEREDNMADVIRLAAVQFGLPYMEIVAEVLAEVGLGTPSSPEVRTMIRQQFVALMERLAQENN